MNNSMTTELKPCPFCGSSETAFSEPPAPWLVICGKCGAEGPYADKRKDAFQAWQSRPQPIVTTDGLVELVAAILKRQRANRYAEEAIASSDLIDGEDAREIVGAVLAGAENVR